MVIIKTNIRSLPVNEGYSGRRFKTKEHKKWHKSLLLLLSKSYKLQETSFFEIYLKFGFSSSASDWDNCIKFFVDTLAKKYRFNDKIIRRAVIETEIINKGFEFVEWVLLPYSTS